MKTLRPFGRSILNVLLMSAVSLFVLALASGEALAFNPQPEPPAKSIQPPSNPPPTHVPASQPSSGNPPSAQIGKSAGPTPMAGPMMNPSMQKVQVLTPSEKGALKPPAGYGGPDAKGGMSSPMSTQAVTDEEHMPSPGEVGAKGIIDDNMPSPGEQQAK